MADLKSYRNSELKWYLLANVLLLLLSSSNNILARLFIAEGIAWEAVSAFLQTALLSTFSYVIVFILDSLPPTELKDKVIFLWSKKPSHTIFTTIEKKCKDDRFTCEQIKAKHPEAFQSCNVNQQTRLWYAIYSKHRDAAMVHSSNRDYLLARDLCVQTVILLLVYLFLCVVSGELSYSLLYIGYLVVMYVLTNLATRNKARRFAFNVLAYDISIKEEPKDG
ncbi:MAG: hypothetical protein FWH55_12715 [Oscillospiraceae bacterium]|nr:hypothetical protein [Oscillospiraceae bacterium]